MGVGRVKTELYSNSSDRLIPLRARNASLRSTTGTSREICAERPFIVVRIMRDGGSALFATGVYLDRLREADGQLRFAERIVVCDSFQFDTLLVIPL